MALEVLTPELMESVRVLLGEDATTLPDATLGSLLIGGVAERDVLARIGDPPYAERSAADQEAIQAAVAYHTAARALDTQRKNNASTSEKFSQQYTEARQPIDLGAWAADLRAQGNAALDPLLPTTGGGVHFGLAQGRRGA